MRRVILFWVFLLTPLFAYAQPDAHIAIIAAIKDSITNVTGKELACAITEKAAWAFRAEGFGHIVKTPGQNGCDSALGGYRHAVDALMKQDGTTIDILANSETDNTPAWQVVINAPISSWRAPFNPDASTPEQPIPPVPPVPTPIPDPTLAARVGVLEAAVLHLSELLRDVVTILEDLKAATPKGCKASVFGFSVRCELTK